MSDQSTTRPAIPELSLDDTRCRYCTHCKARLAIDEPDCCDSTPTMFRMWLADENRYMTSEDVNAIVADNAFRVNNTSQAIATQWVV